MLVRTWDVGTRIRCCGNVKSSATLENSLAVFQKIKRRPHEPVIPFLDVYPRNIKTYTHIKRAYNVQSSFIYNSQKGDTTQMFLNG